MVSASSEKKRIVVIGGGFAGLFNARHLYQTLGDSVSIELLPQTSVLPALRI